MSKPVNQTVKTVNHFLSKQTDSFTLLLDVAIYYHVPTNYDQTPPACFQRQMCWNEVGGLFLFSLI